MQNDVTSVTVELFTLGIERRVECSTRVDYDDVPGIQKIREIEESRVGDRVVIDSRNHEAHLIARESTHFRWLVSRDFVTNLEVEWSFECNHAASTAARPSS